MSLSLEEKKAIVQEVAGVAASAHSAVAAEYRGLTVSDLNELRSRARAAGVYMRVVKNTLAKRAVENTEFACMQEGLSGPLLLAFSQSDPGSAARVVRDFAKGNDKLVTRVVAIGGKLMGPESLAAVASLPTRDEALATMLAVMKAPVEKFARTLNAVPVKLARTLVALREQRESA